MTIYRITKHWPSKLNPDKTHIMAVALTDDRHEADRLVISLSRHYSEDWPGFHGVYFIAEEVAHEPLDYYKTHWKQ